MLDQLLSTSGERVLLVVLSTIGVFIMVITYTRIAGLRSFSKMSSFDFAMTIAVGSLMAAVALRPSDLIEGIIALAVLYAVQFIIAFLRRYAPFSRLVDNKPILVMSGSKMLRNNMRTARITEDDIISKLREANVTDMKSVLAVIFESTGDISVLHGEGPLDISLLEDVKGSEHLKQN